MTEHTDTTIRNAAAAVRDLVADINHGGGSGSIGARLYVTLGAVASAAGSIKALADDLRGNSDVGTTGTELRAALKRIGVRT